MLRVLDPSGAAGEWLLQQFPDAEIHRAPDDTGPYDAALLYGDLDNGATDPGKRIIELSQHVKRPDGRIYVSVPEGTASGKFNVRTPGRRRAWRSVDVADFLRRFGRLEEFGVDDDGYISAAIAPMGKGREIAIWTGYAIGPWHPMDITTRGLGGSETAAYRLAETLADMGHVVTLYGHFNQEGAVKDVILRDWRRFDPTEERRAVIAFRDSAMFEQPVNAETKILWLEDVAGAEGLTPHRASNIDYICGVSEWHRQNILDVYPDLPHEKVIASRNGITRSYFEGEQPEREKRLLYTSSPDRGLDIVLECWPKILERVPDATFFHTYGPWYDIVAKVSPETAAHRARCSALSEHPSIHPVGGLGQKDLAMLMRSSMAWCAPSYFSMGKVKFSETSCIGALEAQAAGCRVVCSNWGALTETVQTGDKIDGDPMSDEWREKFIDAVVTALTDPAVQETAQTEGPDVTAHKDWYPVCLQLESLWGHKPAKLQDGLVLTSV